MVLKKNIFLVVAVLGLITIGEAREIHLCHGVREKIQGLRSEAEAAILEVNLRQKVASVHFNRQCFPSGNTCIAFVPVANKFSGITRNLHFVVAWQCVNPPGTFTSVVCLNNGSCTLE